MNPNELMVEARARIIWGEESSSVRYFLTSNGMSAADADAQLAMFTRERNAEIRKLGFRNVLIGVALIGVGGILLYVVFATPQSHTAVTRRGRVSGALVVAVLYGLWKLINGIIYLVRPKSEHGSIPDISE